MKKLLFTLTILFAFTTVTFANVKTTVKKAAVKREIQKRLKTEILKHHESCIVMQTRTEFELIGDRVIWGDTTSFVQIDLACLRILVGTWGVYI